MAFSFIFGISDTWVCPPDVFSVEVECIGAGGGSGAATGTNSAAAGGGGGFYAKKTISVTPGTSYTVTVGVGGIAGTAAVPNGGKGGDSWFGTAGTVFAQGGLGGPGAAKNGSIGTASSPLDVSIGDVTYRGGSGASGRLVALGGAANGGGGGGGAAYQALGLFASNSTAGGATGAYGGAGGNGGSAAGGQNGSAPQDYGGGAGGPWTSVSADRLGTAGRRGMVRLTYDVQELYLFT